MPGAQKLRETPASPEEETGEPHDNMKKQLGLHIGDKRTHYRLAIITRLLLRRTRRKTLNVHPNNVQET